MIIQIILARRSLEDDHKLRHLFGGKGCKPFKRKVLRYFKLEILYAKTKPPGQKRGKPIFADF